MAQINKPDEYFNTLLWTGNSSTQSITGNNFIADLTWSKSRSDAESHILMDTVRDAGTTLNQAIISNSTNAEGLLNNSSTLTVNSTGFDLDGTSGGTLNFNGYTYATWLWRAGGHTGSSNTDGSITSTVSANTTSGFSIVSYTGNATAGETVGHGLGVTPSMIILRNRDIVENWFVYHKDLTLSGVPAENVYLTLDTTNAVADYPVWNDTAPGSNVFTVSQHAFINGSGNNIIAYCFAEKQGYSKFGSYVGNGTGDGSFIYTGFKPAFVMVKNTSAARNWTILDNKRDAFNSCSIRLFPNSSEAEAGSVGSEAMADILSNGFKTRTNDANFNASGNNYIYMAFAENPLVGTNNIPATAR